MTPDDTPVPVRRARRVRPGAARVPAQASDDAPDGGILTIPASEVAEASHPGSSTVPDDVLAPPSTIATVPLSDAATAVPTVPAFVPAPAAGSETPAAGSETPAVVSATPAAGSATPVPVATATAPVPTWGPGERLDPAGFAVEAAAPAATLTHTALAWVDESALAADPVPGDLTAAATPYVAVDADLLSDLPHRSPLRAGVVVPALAIAGLLAGYSATTLLWPLHAVAPTVSAIQVQPIAAPAAAPAWPAQGSAAEAVGGIPGTLSTTTEPDSIASITKLVTALVVLDELPLAPGEQGPDYRFNGPDNLRYWQYRAGGESALDVPVGGSLSEYQMLEGMLIGSANNYADRLAQGLWPTDAVYASAANEWLAAHGVRGVTVYEPTGMDPRNAASPEALVTLAQKALAHPVIAEIVAKKSVDLPGAGHVENTNGLLADAGVVGLKTGTLDAWNLLSAKDITVGDTTVRLYASVLGQPDDESRLAASRAIYTQLEKELQLKPSVTAGTVTGRVETLWGDEVDIVTSDDASVVLWNGGTGAVSPVYDLGDRRDRGDVVGSLTVTGPLDETTVDLQLADEITDPSPWWRLTHPLDLFGLNG